MGLGLPAAAWWRTVPILGRALQVIAFDNRGSGRSDRPPGPYSLADMAADAVAVLDAAGIEHAHVYGVSMGGMIAQEVALRHPDRVRALVLGATSPGGAAATPPDADTIAFLQRRPSMPDEEGRWASVPYVYSARTRREAGDRISEDFARRQLSPFHADGYRAQLAAALATQAAVTVARQNGHLRVEVTDDGIGGADAARGTGLAGLVDRVTAVDGTVRLSSPVGGPTILTVELPCAS